MSSINFTATDSSHQLEQGYNVLAFFNDDEYVFLQRLEEIGHKEDDGVYLEYNNQIHAGYDVIAAIELSLQQLKITLTSPLYQLPGVDTVIINVELSEQQLASYGELLVQLFTDRVVEVTIK